MITTERRSYTLQEYLEIEVKSHERNEYIDLYAAWLTQERVYPFKDFEKVK